LVETDNKQKRGEKPSVIAVAYLLLYAERLEIGIVSIEALVV